MQLLCPLLVQLFPKCTRIHVITYTNLTKLFLQRIITMRIILCMRHSTCSPSTLILPRRKNSEHSRDSFRGKCSMIVSLFFTATAYRSEEFLGSLSHTNASPTVAAQTLLCFTSSFPFFSVSFVQTLCVQSFILCCTYILLVIFLFIYIAKKNKKLFIYVVAVNAISFEKLFHGSYSLRTFFPTCVVNCKIFVLKYFRKTSILRKFFNTKIFPTKISYNENFPIYGSYKAHSRIQNVNFLFYYFSM